MSKYSIHAVSHLTLGISATKDKRWQDTDITQLQANANLSTTEGAGAILITMKICGIVKDLVVSLIFFFLQATISAHAFELELSYVLSKIF